MFFTTLSVIVKILIIYMYMYTCTLYMYMYMYVHVCVHCTCIYVQDVQAYTGRMVFLRQLPTSPGLARRDSFLKRSTSCLGKRMSSFYHFLCDMQLHTNVKDLVILTVLAVFFTSMAAS